MRLQGRTDTQKLRRKDAIMCKGSLGLVIKGREGDAPGLSVPVLYRSIHIRSADGHACSVRPANSLQQEQALV